MTLNYTKNIEQVNKRTTVFSSENERNNSHNSTFALSDSMSLLINEPIIIYNWTHVSIINLTITFINGTDICQADSEDNVTIIVYNSIGFFKRYSLVYNNISNQNWTITFDTYEYPPRKFFIDLEITTGEYQYFGTIYSFSKYFEILIESPFFFINNEEQTLTVQCYITTIPYDNREYILVENSKIHANVYFNATNEIISSPQLNWTGGYSGFHYSFWSDEINVTDYIKGYYYVIVSVEYDDEVYFSLPSDVMFKEDVETTELTISVYSKPILLIFSFSTLSIVYRIFKKKTELYSSKG